MSAPRRRPRTSTPAPPPGFTEFVMGRSASLFRTALLLTRDPHTAQDLLQTALTKGWQRWERIEGEPEAYVRRIVVNQFLSDRTRRWHGERPAESVPEQPVHDRLVSAPSDPGTAVPDRAVLVEAVGALPPRQRAVVVLRYFHDLTEAQTADVMGTSVGTVKSQHSKALAALRISEHLTETHEEATAAGRKDLS